MAESIYLYGWETEFEDIEKRQHIFNTLAIDKKTAEHPNVDAMEFEFEDGKLSRVYQHECGERLPIRINEEHIGFPKPSSTPNPLLLMEWHPNGYHQLGGTPPDNFIYPECNCDAPVQYIGFFSNQDPYLSWLPFDLHIACPYVLNYHAIYLDYTNYLAPEILNKKEVEAAKTPLIDLKKSSRIIYETKRFRYSEDLGEEDAPIFLDELGQAGVPSFIQHSFIPTCPKSGKMMRFVGQTRGGITTVYSDVIPHKESWREYYEVMEFWSSGDLFVFFEPTTQMVCCFIQDT